MLLDSFASQGVKAMIIHNVYIVNQSSIYIEITLLHENGKEHCDYKRALIKKYEVVKWIAKSKTNLIVSQLKQSDVQCNVTQEETNLLGIKQDISDNLFSVAVGQDPKGRHIEDCCDYASDTTNYKKQM
jgi:hypothetical protein